MGLCNLETYCLSVEILFQDHLERGNLDFSSLKFRVLDEADEMLKMGFVDDVELILGNMMYLFKRFGQFLQFLKLYCELINKLIIYVCVCVWVTVCV